MADPVVRERLAAAGPAAIDGYGAFRARDAILAAVAGTPAGAVLPYRPATRADSELLLDVAQRSGGARRLPLHRGRGTRAARALACQHPRRPDRTLLVVEQDGEPAGTVRFDTSGERAEISVTIAPGRRGGGLGARAIREAAELELAARPRLREVVAEVQERNNRSLRAFERAGYRRLPEGQREGSVVLDPGSGGPPRDRLH